MTEFDARIIITLKQGVLDPQGQATTGALSALGFGQVHSVRQGKVMDVELQAGTLEEAQSSLIEMCERLLANTVIEDYAVEAIAPKAVDGR